MILSCSSSPRPNQNRVLAITMLKISKYVLDHDFVIDKIDKFFSRKEIIKIKKFRKEIVHLIKYALDRNHSVGAAYLASYLKCIECYSSLRYRLLSPGRAYGWEGPDYSMIESYLTDNQYVYHYPYLISIVSIFKKPIHKIIFLTENERSDIISLSNNKDHESYHWAIWIRRKLKI